MRKHLRKLKNLNKVQIVSLVTLTAVVTLLIALLVFPLKESSNETGLYLSPNRGKVVVDNNVLIEVRANTGSQAINAAQINLSYNPTLLEFVRVEGAGSSLEITAATDGGDGNVNIERASLSNPSGDMLLATVVFKAKQGEGAATVGIAESSIVTRSSDGQPLTATKKDATYSLVAR